MQRYWIWTLLPLLAAAGSARGETRRAVFEGAGTEHTWALKDLDPGLPADWSPYQFLVLELRLSAPQRFDLRIHDAGGIRSVRLAPVPGAWIRSAVPLSFLSEAAHQGMDLASVHNKARPMMFINLSGTPGELKSVRQIGVVMANPIGAPTLEIRAVRLTNQDPGDALLEAKPLVDQFGQWMGDDWPGKAASLDQLQAAWAAEEKALGKGDSSYCHYGGYEGTKAKATGFFRVEKIDGKWWFVDPDGHLFLSLGADSIGTSVSTSTQGREALFAALPPAGLSGGRGGASFYAWNMVRRLECQVDRPDRAPHVRLGLQYRRQLERSAPRQRPPRAVCGDPARLGNRDRPHGRPRRLCAGVRRQHRSRGRPTVRCAQRRPLRAGVFPGQRTALAGPRIGGRGCHPRRPGQRSEESREGIPRRWRFVRTPLGVPLSCVPEVRRGRHRGHT